MTFPELYPGGLTFPIPATAYTPPKIQFPPTSPSVSYPGLFSSYPTPFLIFVCGGEWCAPTGSVSEYHSTHT